jgi:CHAD domain-containing protein
MGKITSPRKVKRLDKVKEEAPKAAAAAVAAGAALAAGKVVRDRIAGDGDDGGPSRAFKLKPGEKVPAGFRRIALGQVDNALDELEGRAGHPPDKAIHEARKSFKRERALLRLGRPGLDTDVFRRENSGFRDAGRRLAGIRDADVMLETLDGLVERSDELDASRIKNFRAALEAKRDQARAGIEHDDETVAGAVAELRLARDRIPEHWEIDGGWKALRDGLVRTYGRGRDEQRRATKSLSTEDLHEWRKRVKDLWHQLQVVREAWPEILEPLADEAHELANHLGDDHDLAVLQDQAAQHSNAFESAKDRKALVAAAEARRRELQEQAAALGARLYAERPKDFGRRLDAYWQARPATVGS